jgi:hypothetical protein
MFTLPFEYNGSNYSALVHEKYLANGKQYRITIMNGELEQLLFGNHILIEKDGLICPGTTPKPENEKLILQLIHNLKECMDCSAVY